MIAFNPADQSMWCVGTDGNFARWNTDKNGWDDQGGSWKLNMIAFIDGQICGVGTEGNIGVWTNSAWLNMSANNWTLKMVTWDSAGTMWCVGTDGNVGKWVP
jgi:hypothetical protein